MRLSNFIRERRPVTIAGRRFIIAKPTLATVQIFLDGFPAMISGAVEMWRALGCPMDRQSQESIVSMFCVDREQALRVLRSFVEWDDGPATIPLKELALAALAGVDLPRIIERLGLLAPSAGVHGPDEMHGQIVAIAEIAREYGVTPFDVMEWPYEGFLDICEIRAGRPVQGEASGTVEPELLDLIRQANRERDALAAEKAN